MNHALQAWLDGIGRYGWAAAEASRTAREAGLSAAELLLQTGDRYDALSAFASELDRLTREAVPDAGSTRDRLFDSLMAGFDVLQANRAAVLNLLVSRDPAIPAILLPKLLASLRRVGEAVGIDLRLPLGPIRLAALGAIHARALATWRSDVSPDMEQVMAQLDRDLSRAESWAEGRGEIASLPIGRFVIHRDQAQQPSPDHSVE